MGNTSRILGFKRLTQSNNEFSVGRRMSVTPYLLKLAGLIGQKPSLSWDWVRRQLEDYLSFNCFTVGCSSISSVYWLIKRIRKDGSNGYVQCERSPLFSLPLYSVFSTNPLERETTHQKKDSFGCLFTLKMSNMLMFSWQATPSGCESNHCFL